MVACSDSAPSADSAADKPQGLESAKFAPGPHRRLPLRSLDAIVLLPAVLLMEVDRAAVALQCDAHFGCGLTCHYLNRFSVHPNEPHQMQPTSKAALSWRSFQLLGLISIFFFRQLIFIQGCGFCFT